MENNKREQLGVEPVSMTAALVKFGIPALASLGSGLMSFFNGKNQAESQLERVKASIDGNVKLGEINKAIAKYNTDVNHQMFQENLEFQRETFALQNEKVNFYNYKAYLFGIINNSEAIFKMQSGAIGTFVEPLQEKIEAIIKKFHGVDGVDGFYNSLNLLPLPTLDGFRSAGASGLAGLGGTVSITNFVSERIIAFLKGANRSVRLGNLGFGVYAVTKNVRPMPHDYSHSFQNFYYNILNKGKVNYNYDGNGEIRYGAYSDIKKWNDKNRVVLSVNYYNFKIEDVNMECVGALVYDNISRIHIKYSFYEKSYTETQYWEEGGWFSSGDWYNYNNGPWDNKTVCNSYTKNESFERGDVGSKNDFYNFIIQSQGVTFEKWEAMGSPLDVAKVLSLYNNYKGAGGDESISDFMENIDYNLDLDFAKVQTLYNKYKLWGGAKSISDFMKSVDYNFDRDLNYIKGVTLSERRRAEEGRLEAEDNQKYNEYLNNGGLMSRVQWDNYDWKFADRTLLATEGKASLKAEYDKYVATETAMGNTPMSQAEFEKRGREGRESLVANSAHLVAEGTRLAKVFTSFVSIKAELQGMYFNEVGDLAKLIDTFSVDRMDILVRNSFYVFEKVVYPHVSKGKGEIVALAAYIKYYEPDVFTSFTDGETQALLKTALDKYEDLYLDKTVNALEELFGASIDMQTNKPLIDTAFFGASYFPMLMQAETLEVKLFFDRLEQAQKESEDLFLIGKLDDISKRMINKEDYHLLGMVFQYLLTQKKLYNKEALAKIAEVFASSQGVFLAELNNDIQTRKYRFPNYKEKIRKAENDYVVAEKKKLLEYMNTVPFSFYVEKDNGSIVKDYDADFVGSFFDKEISKYTFNYKGTAKWLIENDKKGAYNINVRDLAILLNTIKGQSEKIQFTKHGYYTLLRYMEDERIGSAIVSIDGALEQVKEGSFAPNFSINNSKMGIVDKLVEQYKDRELSISKIANYDIAIDEDNNVSVDLGYLGVENMDVPTYLTFLAKVQDSLEPKDVEMMKEALQNTENGLEFVNSPELSDIDSSQTTKTASASMWLGVAVIGIFLARAVGKKK